MVVDVAQLYGLADDLGNTKRQVQRELKAAITEVTEQVKEDARARVPVLTGTLRDSIESSVRGTRGEVGTDLRYAPFVEFGDYKDEPQPFLIPAGDVAAQTLPAAVEQAVTKALGF